MDCLEPGLGLVQIINLDLILDYQTYVLLFAFGLLRQSPVVLGILNGLLIFVESYQVGRFSLSVSPFHPRFSKRSCNTDIGK